VPCIRLLRAIPVLGLLLAPNIALADSTLAAMTAASVPTGAELLYCSQGGADRKCTTAQLSAMAPVWGDFSTSFFYPVYPMQLAAAGGAVGAANVIQCTPGIISQKITLAGLSASVTTLSAGGNFQLAIYTSVSGRPGTVIANTGSGSTASVAFVSPTFAAGSGSSVQVGPGGAQGGTNLWFCANRDNAVSVFTPNGAASPGAYGTTALLGSATTANLLNVTSAVVGISCSGAACNGGSSTFGTWPATLTGSTWTDVKDRSMPIVFYQPNSIP